MSKSRKFKPEIQINGRPTFNRAGNASTLTFALTKQEVQAIRTAAGWDGTNVNSRKIPDAYKVVYNILTREGYKGNVENLLANRYGVIRSDARSVDGDVLYWFRNAIDINRGQGPASQFIRDYTKFGSNTTLSKDKLDAISNDIGNAVLSDIIKNGRIPKFAEMVKNDINEVLQVVNDGQTDYSRWGGSFYYWDLPLLNEDKSFTVDPRGGGAPNDYLTIGDTIQRDPVKYSRFIDNMARTLNRQNGWGDMARGVLGAEALGFVGGLLKLPTPVSDAIFDRMRQLDPTNPAANVLDLIAAKEGPYHLASVGGIPPGFIDPDTGLPWDARTRALRKLFEKAEALAIVAFEKEDIFDDIEKHLQFLSDKVLVFDGSQLGLALGSVLGKRVTSDPFGQIVASAALSTVLGAVGEFIDTQVFKGKTTSTNFLGHGAKGLGKEFLKNLEGAGIGALSSYLTAELINAVGIKGELGVITNSLASAALTKIVTNLLIIERGGAAAEGVTTFSGVGPAVVSAAASYLGSKLASAIYKPDTVGGQIGSAVGAAYGGFVASAILATGLNPVTFLAAVAVVAFFQVIGGLIGSIFGGTPRSGADVSWDADKREFVTTNVWSRKGGSKDTARELADAAGDSLNALFAATGSTLLNPSAVQSGSYGMRKQEFTYRPIGGGSDKGEITARFSGNNGAQNLLTHGVYLGVSSMLGQLAGGDIYVKRALAGSLATTNGNPNNNAAGAAGNFDIAALSGDLTTAQDYSAYLDNATTINALIAADPYTVFSATWITTLARASELGLTRRNATDWIGGYKVFLDEAIDGVVNNVSAIVSNISMGFDAATGERYWGITLTDGTFAGHVEDTIELGSQTLINGTTTADIIDLRSGKLANQIGYTVNRTLNNDIAVSGADFTALSSSVSFAAGALRSSVTVTIANDGVAEARENFIASLSNAPNMRIMGGDAVATIVDGAAALPSLMVGDSFAWEDDGFAIFRLSLSKAANVAITVALALANDKASGGGVDYGAVGANNVQVSADGVTWVNATSATFAAGATELFVRTAVVRDNVANPAYVAPDFDLATGQTNTGNGVPQFLNVEGNERFTLSATVTAGASALANGGVAVSGTGTIVDGAGNEPLVWIDHVVVDEASGQARFVLSRSRTQATASTVDFATSDRRVLDIDIAATVDGGDGNDTIYANDNDPPEYKARFSA